MVHFLLQQGADLKVCCCCLPHAYAILGSNYAEMAAKEQIRNAFYVYIDLWTTYHGIMSTCISSDDVVHTYMLSGHV